MCTLFHSFLGVPVCRQWFPDGFLFATNIAQFGLSHYSQYLIEKPPYNLELVDDDTEQEYWEVSDRDMVVYLTSAEGISQMKFKTDGMHFWIHFLSLSIYCKIPTIYRRFARNISKYCPTIPQLEFNGPAKLGRKTCIDVLIV